MDTKTMKNRLIAILIILLTISSKGFGELKIIGSLEFHVPDYETLDRPWIKVKQNLIERKGLAWLLKHQDLVEVFILNHDTDCGLFVRGRDSMLLMEIKKSIDKLSESDETILVQYAYPLYELVTEGPQRPFDSKRYKSDSAYRDSMDNKIWERRFSFVKNLDKTKRFKMYWFLSDSILYHAPKCTSLFSYPTQEAIGIESVVDEYLAECRSLGYEPILYGKSKTLPSWISEEGADSRPEMQLLYKYIKRNDSIVLNTSLPKDIYDINFVYDHTKTENVPPTIIGKKPLREVYNSTLPN